MLSCLSGLKKQDLSYSQLFFFFKNQIVLLSSDNLKKIEWQAAESAESLFIWTYYLALTADVYFLNSDENSISGFVLVSIYSCYNPYH